MINNPRRKRNDTQAIPIRLPDGREFPSMNACSRALCTSLSTISFHLERGTLHLIGHTDTPKNNCRPVTIDGQHYPSKTAALSALGVSRWKLERMLRDELS